MNKLARIALDQGLALNQRLSASTANSIDWLFKRDTLIKSGRTWFELVHDGDLMAVRYYELPEEDEIELADGSTMAIEREQHPVPLVLVPPLGVTTETFDLMPQRSLVRYLVARGFKVYLLDWGKPKKEHAHLGILDYCDDMMGTALEKIRRHSGSKTLSLMGWCMGGLLCLFYQGINRDPHIRNIVTVASPIDMESGKGVISQLAGIAQALDGPAQLVSNYSKLRLNTLDPARLSLPDWATTIVFKLTDPVGSVTTYWDLVTRLWDREFVESYSTTSDYLNNMLRYPGGVLQDMAGGVVMENQIARGKVELHDKLAEIDRIESSLLAFAGERDNLVPAEVAERIVELVASRDKEFRLAPGGHMGVIIGSKAQGAVWAESADWLVPRSQDKPFSKRRSRSGAKARSSSKATAESRTKAKAKAKAKAKTKAKTKARTGSKARVQPKLKAG
ncbi:alpha/beta fold hydrolase [Seongchinamella sediminis]|uniref:Alpha/beta fold hydrolase n=1 Tax=Seongchinamella sediminis TaxID=2283635 RepID=A0A3L7E1G3_9GAMM|nr:alpha/beta fold hydrolase [Seongchinamella sediminis]RLQ22715.1 alpha/beta fold hydrolase [Seongchinamella sediminis]